MGTENMDKIKQLITEHKKAVIIISAIAILGIIMLGGGKKQQQTSQQEKAKPSITQEEKMRAEMEAMRKEIEELKKQNETLKKGEKPDEGKGKGDKVEQLPPIFGDEKKPIKDLKDMLSGKPHETPKLPEPGTTQGIKDIPAVKPEPPRLVKIDLEQPAPAPPKETKKREIYLPAGSFASFTTLSGIYAPETGQQMPVTGIFDKAFIGPNRTSIPLRGCLFLGKARGDTGIGRADIKVVKISCVMPDGNTFESEVAGYVSDLSGEFGIEGKVNRHAGSFFSTVGITSFIEGFSAGLARAQEVQEAVASESSTSVATNVVGSATQYGLFKGINLFASAAKQFFGSQLNGLIPSVDVHPGARGYVYITTGIKIPVGENNAIVNTGYYDPYNLSHSK